MTQGLQLPTPDAIREAQRRSQERMRDTMQQAKAQDGEETPADEDTGDADDDDDEESEESEDGGDPDINAALAVIERSPKALARLKQMLGIHEDVYAVRACECPECVWEGSGIHRRAVRQHHWFCFVCGQGPFVWQLTQPPYIKNLTRSGSMTGEAHYCCGSACQAKYEARYGLRRQAEYWPDGSAPSPVTNVAAR